MTLSSTPVTWTQRSEDCGAQLENTFTPAPLFSLISLIFCPLFPMTPPTIDWWMSSLSSLSPSSSSPLVASYMYGMAVRRTLTTTSGSAAITDMTRSGPGLSGIRTW